jgi:Protein of unknown function (DUF1566)/TNFR/NGFR cysteine-rich region
MIKRAVLLAVFFAISGAAATASAAYTKIANNGSALGPAAALGPNPTDWACTYDTVTGLTWEVKTPANMNAKFTWYQSTTDLPQQVNAAGKCGFSDWRLPSYDEVRSIVRTVSAECVDHVDTTYFPNTPRASLWTASELPATSMPNAAVYMHLCYGDSIEVNSKFYGANARLVRGTTIVDSPPSTGNTCTPIAFNLNVTAQPGPSGAYVTVCPASGNVFRAKIFDGTTQVCATDIAANGTATCNATFGLTGTRNLRVEYETLTDTCTTSMRRYLRERTVPFTVSEGNTPVCSAGEYISSPATVTSCHTCSACAAGTFTTTTNQSTCTTHRVCSAGSYVSTAGSTTADRACTSCAPGTFSTSENQATCMPFTTCAAGTYVSTAGTSTSDQACTACPSGTVSTNPNQAACTPYGTCAPGSYLVVPGTSSTDTQCAACQAGTYTSSTNQNTCAAHSSCEPGTHVSIAATATNNRTCAACEPGTFSSTENANACAPHTACPPGASISTPGTSTTDQKCGPVEDAGSDAGSGGDAPKDAGSSGTNTPGTDTPGTGNADVAGSSSGASPSGATPTDEGGCQMVRGDKGHAPYAFGVGAASLLAYRRRRRSKRQ